ncbi:hypothetical protein C1H46_013553 [Malus baccata]|uniref:Uncharacterized protein n=1 Tax=Malus baccata TaxID=106549 RepID=A0A540MRG9_MALBA|nr:hypothetical protein C1H46_013553 [Malus baccata]
MDSSSASLALSASSVNLAMAAFVDATLMAISAFYTHKRSVDQVIELLIEFRRKLNRVSSNRTTVEAEEEKVYNKDGEELEKNLWEATMAVADERSRRGRRFST